MLKDSLEPARWQITCVTVVTASFAFVYTQRVKPDRFRERKSCAKVLELLRVVHILVVTFVVFFSLC